ncbi:Uncharacterized protein dnm_009550 [Desulfonema magnum]|uniref:Uncharacterized protein n=1 Tax=Desulfonema magnum TaxID=45655 RepID=A0A975BGH6_9BACT|nr:Uncharacterized protein dnm_009550 [Desulfonema magnum]
MSEAETFLHIPLYFCKPLYFQKDKGWTEIKKAYKFSPSILPPFTKKLHKQKVFSFVT